MFFYSLDLKQPSTSLQLLAGQHLLLEHVSICFMSFTETPVNTIFIVNRELEHGLILHPSPNPQSSDSTNPQNYSPTHPP